MKRKSILIGPEMNTSACVTPFNTDDIALFCSKSQGDKKQYKNNSETQALCARY